MRWDYDSKWRDMFDDGVHRDILIVPHGTRVTKVSGKAPIIESKVPKFYPDDDPDSSHHIDGDITKEGKRIPNEYAPVEWTITNEDIIKEKFEYADSLCSSDKLSFGSCEAAMVKFTIRNNKTYNDETKEWELDVPNLQKIEVVDDDGKTLIGELQGAAVINVWTYIDGDSDSLMWLGMYKVEQDKASGNGYEREIIAYDFMLTFRDMDIFNWYKALFDGTPIDSDDWSKGLNTHYPKYNVWTIGEALKNLFDNLAYFSPDRPTTTNPKEFLLDMDADKYPGYGIPILLDPDLWNMELPAISVDESPEHQFLHERYGGMRVMDLPFYQDEKIMKKQALSCGKFLEDIAALAGRFGCIRKDIFKDDEYENPDSTKKHRYNMYEKCYLTFRPLPSSETAEVDNGKIQSENVFDDSEIEKGIQYEHYDTKEVKIVEAYDYDRNELFHYHPKGLSKAEKAAYKNGDKALFNIFTYVENMFIAYLKKSNGDLKNVIDILQGKFSGQITVPDWDASMARDEQHQSTTPVTKTITYTSGVAYLRPGFNSMVNRPYRAYQLSTTSDLCRMPGDIILVEGVDKITGEPYKFKSFILTRRCTGIQKQMDKYTAKGETYAGTYSDYRAGELNDSFHPQSLGYGKVGGNGGNGTTEINITGMTEEDYIEVQRNNGIRYLNEPSNASAVYDSGNNKVILTWKDPVDITTWRPHPCEWEGTVVVRKEGSRPLHRWDGTVVVNSTTRNQYENNGYEDTGVEPGKKYFYGFMPYFTVVDDTSKPVKRYRWTKSVEVSTDVILTAPEITKANASETNITVKYKITLPASGSFSSLKLCYKKNDAPSSVADADVAIDILPTSNKHTFTDLDENATYYFVIFATDSTGESATSNIKHAKTATNSGIFSYTGDIQTYVVPKTGVYSIETWGAQGESVSDGSANARGGFGAYAYGEMVLYKGDVLYICVGGQDGYNGGGNENPPNS